MRAIKVGLIMSAVYLLIIVKLCAEKMIGGA